MPSEDAGQEHAGIPQEASASTPSSPLRGGWRWIGTPSHAAAIQAVAAVALTAITFFYTWYAKQQVDRVTESIDLSRAAMQIDQRAWLGVLAVELSKEPVDAGPVTVRFKFKNSGKTPARNVIARPWVAIKPTQTDPPPDTDPQPRVTVVFPDVSMYTTSLVLDVWPETARAYVAGKLNVYAWLTLEYEDVFGNKHVTRSCYVYVPGAPPAAPPSCSSGSAAD